MKLSSLLWISRAILDDTFESRNLLMWKKCTLFLFLEFIVTSECTVITVNERQGGTFSLIRESIMAPERGTGSLGMAIADGISCRKRHQQFHSDIIPSWMFDISQNMHRIKEDLHHERYDRILTSQRLLSFTQFIRYTSNINSFNMLASFILITFLWLRTEIPQKEFLKSVLAWIYYRDIRMVCELYAGRVFKSGDQIYRSILISKKWKGGYSLTSPTCRMGKEGSGYNDNRIVKFKTKSAPRTPVVVFDINH